MAILVPKHIGLAQQKAEEDYSKQFEAALDSNQIPNTPDAIARIARIMHNSLDKGHDMSVEEAARIFKDEQNNNINGFLSQLSPEQLLELIGEKRMNAIRKKDLGKLKNPIRNQPNTNTPKSSDNGKKISASDFFNS